MHKRNKKHKCHKCFRFITCNQCSKKSKNESITSPGVSENFQEEKLENSDDFQPIVTPKPDEIRLKNVLQCSKYKLEAMKYLVLSKDEEERLLAMDYLAGDVITSNWDQPEVNFFPGMVKEQRKFIPEDTLEEMKNLINFIVADEGTEEDFESELKATHTLENVDLIIGNFNYTSLLLDKFVGPQSKIPVIQVSNPQQSTGFEINLEVKHSQVKVEQSFEPNLISNRKFVPDISKPKPLRRRRTVATQTIHPELMEMIISILTDPSGIDKFKESYKKLCQHRTSPKNLGENTRINKCSVASQTVVEMIYDNRCRFNSISATPKRKMEDILKSSQKIPKSTANLKRPQIHFKIDNVPEKIGKNKAGNEFRKNASTQIYKKKAEQKEASTQVRLIRKIGIRRSPNYTYNKVGIPKITTNPESPQHVIRHVQFTSKPLLIDSNCRNSGRTLNPESPQNIVRHVQYSFKPSLIDDNCINFGKTLSRSLPKSDLTKSDELDSHSLMNDDEKLKYIKRKRRKK